MQATDAAPQFTSAPKQGTERPVPEIFETGEFRAPRSLRLIQQVEQSVSEKLPQAGGIAPVGARLTDASWTATSREPHPALSLKTEFLESRRGISRVIPAQDAGTSRDTNPVSISANAGPASLAVGPKPVRPERRKIPRTGTGAAQWGVAQRQDWALYNKDMGDLTDPYEQPLRAASGNDRMPHRS
jgi:hypothetical protein